MKSEKKSKSRHFVKVISILTRLIGVISPAIAARVFSLVWFKVSKSRPHPNREAWLNACEKRQVQHRGTKLSVYLRSPVSPRGRVVLLHGWSGRWDQMLAIADTLSIFNFEVIVFDLPSHGEAAGNETDIFELSEFLKSVFETLNLDSPILVCHSAGFLTVSHAVLKRNLAFSKLITISSPSRFAYLMEVFRERIGFSKRIDVELWKAIERRVGVKDVQVQLETNHMSRVDSKKIFIIHDQDDKEVKFDELSKMKMMWPKAKVLETKGLGHNRILSSQTVIDEIKSFCTEG